MIAFIDGSSCLLWSSDGQVAVLVASAGNRP